MHDYLDDLVDAFAHQLARDPAWPREQLRPVVRQLVIEARRQYRENGAPYGDTAEGLLRSIMETKPRFLRSVARGA
jgi:hypothetical protein